MGGRYSPLVSGIGAAVSAGGLYGRVVRNIKNKRKWSKYKEQPWNPPTKKRKIPPKTPASSVPAKYAIATRMTKFKKQTPAKEKVPKSAIVHYKDFGQFKTEKCMWINHEHWGHVDKFWKGIAYGLTKMLLPKAKLYTAKSLDDPVIGPRTKFDDVAQQYDDKSAPVRLRLIFCTEAQNSGNLTFSFVDVPVEDVNNTPDVYRSFDAIANDVAAALKSKYDQDATDRTWLQAAQFRSISTSLNAQPIYVQNLDDAEIHLYVNTLIKFQNVTESDSGRLDKLAIDANPIQGRMYTAKHHKPMIDADLLMSGEGSLDTFFSIPSGDTGQHTGFHLLGSDGLQAVNNDLGRIQHIPPAKELYGNQTVKSAVIYMKAGDMKYHKTRFSMKKTFRQLAKLNIANASAEASHEAFSSHTLFGFGLAHKHGEDTLSVGFNRDQDVGCYVTHKRVVHPIKTNYTTDTGLVEVTAATINPTDHAIS
mgnify:CR=1 FL=1